MIIISIFWMLFVTSLYGMEFREKNTLTDSDKRRLDESIVILSDRFFTWNENEFEEFLNNNFPKLEGEYRKKFYNRVIQKIDNKNNHQYNQKRFFSLTLSVGCISACYSFAQLYSRYCNPSDQDFNEVICDAERNTAVLSMGVTATSSLALLFLENNSPAIFESTKMKQLLKRCKNLADEKK